MFCPNCGYKNESNDGFCENCGRALKQAQEASYENQNSTYQSNNTAAGNYQATSFTSQGGVDNSTLTMGQYLVSMLLGMIPIVGIVFYFIWSFGGDVNTNKKNWARATLIFGAIFIVFMFIFYGIAFRVMMDSYI